MSSRSNLIIALMSATALLAIDAVSIGRAHAETITLGDNIDASLDKLASEPDKFGVELNGINEALAPPSDDIVVETVPETVDPTANPFVKAKPEALKKVSVEAVPAKTATEANPFAMKQNPTANDQTTSSEPKPAVVDDSALQFYAAHKDLKRLGAEMRRLKALYPQWQPPGDLFAEKTNVDEQPLWDIYAMGDYAQVRANIALLQSTTPQWKPSADLINKLQMAETRTLINRAFAQKRWHEVIETARTNSHVLVCVEMQAVWNVAEALARTRNYAESFDLYKYVLTNCEDPKLRLATVQKASLLLPPQGTAGLISLGHVMPDGSKEFENLAFDGLRSKIGTYIKDGNFDSPPPDDQLAEFVDFVQRTRSSADASLIAWFFYAQEDWKTANSWFLQSAKYERTPKNIEGVVLTLRNMDQPEAALKIAKRFAGTSKEIADQYVEIVSSELTSDKPVIKIEKQELASFEKMVTARESALGAQALGWKYLEDGKKDVAEQWFADSVSWDVTEGGVIGLAVMAARAKDTKTLSELKQKYSKEYEALSDFKIYKSKAIKAKKKKKRVVAEKKSPKARRFFLFAG